MQNSEFAADEYQEWRQRIVGECHAQVCALNQELVSVKLQRQYVEKYKKAEALILISEEDKGELIAHIAPLVYLDDDDEYAKRFDNFMYGLMLASIEEMPSFKKARNELCKTATALESKITIPQVKAVLTDIKEINTDAYWDANDILVFEKTRETLRGLIKFLVDESNRQPIKVRLEDPIISEQEGVMLDPAYDFEDYKKKVNRYVMENSHTLAIYKLTHNIQLAPGDYQELERILTQELGTKEDYQREYGDTPFGLLVRKIAKLDHEAAMAAFSQFINDESLNQKQISFVHKIINHIEQNGYMDAKDLLKPPFDKPASFVKLFDFRTRSEIIRTINGITENATKVAA